MDTSKQTKNKRDVIMIIGVMILFVALFFTYQAFAYGDEAARAFIYYGNLPEPIVTIDFNRGKVTVHRTQDTSGDIVYPYVDEDDQTITLLGDYEISGIRQIVVIAYDYVDRSVEVIRESSPNNICSREGVSTGKPLICLPNRIRIEFDTSDADFIV
jgi:hypothetical protein